jgi:hypothetical protein
MFSSTGSFLKARQYIVSQANKAMHLLYTRIRNLDLPVDLQLKLFDQTIVPILTYNCEIWGIENLDIIEKVQNEFLRKISKSKKSTPLYMLYAEFGRYPLAITIKTRIIKFWSKLITEKESKISKFCYDYMLQSNTTYKWVNFVKKLLDDTGKSFIWINQSNVNLRNIHTQIKRTLIDQFFQTWNAQLNQSSKGKNYQIFKKEIKLEHYLCNLPANLRIALFQFRTGNSKLPVEIGRYQQSHIPYSERKCHLCSMNDIGDELHYLLKCPLFQSMRRKYIPVKYYYRPNVIKFQELLTNETAEIQKNLSIFARHILLFFK